ncbi:Y-family DNA polymerase [Blastopirellula marina]|uniref:Type VI secretion protein ImpB n=1 Tax=Blastopirellula marina TaxID=124 RepID=A0A2S8FQ48_9BACT|nr:type VI secretion protein ImpB [Blastopirellula marina]PQO33974.1 type VI secretion protein ImpB [Blastopirellula marina]PTL43760.1 type VI secretion protein ImpB [Blastopirellula marina]
MTQLNWIMQDMNSYFASVEQFLRPELRHRPIGVVPLESESTCLIAASHEAKRFGLRTGTKVYDARRMCPEIKLVRARPDLYVQVHHQILKSVDQCAEVHHIYSIDEWTIRLRGQYQNPRRAADLAYSIQRQLRKDFGPWLTSSMGIAATRLLAKIASNLKKPDAVTLLETPNVAQRLAHVPLGDLPGIGRAMEARLANAAIHTFPQLWQLERRRATQIWGSVSGASWWDGLHGIDNPEPSTKRHSMTHGRVLDPKYRNDRGAHCILVLLLCKLARRLRATGYFARRLGLTLTGKSKPIFSTHTELPCAQDTFSLLHHFEKLWQRRPRDLRGLKKVDVTVGQLVAQSEVSGYLFDEFSQSQRLSHTLDEISDLWGPNSIYFAHTHGYRGVLEDKIAFGRIPEIQKRNGFNTIA